MEGDEEEVSWGSPDSHGQVSEEVPRCLLSLPAARGRIEALTLVSSLIKDAFHMTAGKGRDTIICEDERGWDLKILQSSAFS